MLSLLFTLKQKNLLLFRAGKVLFLFSLCLFPILSFPSTGVPIREYWFQPFLISFSLGVFFWTLAWLLSYLPINRLHFSTINTLLISVFGFELIINVLLAVHKQFFLFGSLEPFLYVFMSVMIICHVFLLVYLFLLFIILKIEVPVTYLWGIRWGLLLFIFATTATGLALNLQNTHLIDEPSFTSFLLHWHSIGELRASHFVGLHALHFMPFSAWMIYTNRKQWRIHFPVIWVSTIALIYMLYSLYLVFATLSSMSFDLK